MTWTNPPTVATGDFVTAALWNTYIRDNGLYLRGLLPDPGSAGLALVASSTSAAAFGQVATAGLADGAVTGAKAGSGLAVVPSGLIAAFATAAAIASGWARYTAADGRMLVGAGTVWSVTWTESSAYGSSWSHQHGTPGHVHDMGAHNHGMSTQSSGIAGSGTTYATGAATNNASLGNTSTASPTTDLTSWVIPSFAVVWSQKS